VHFLISNSIKSKKRFLAINNRLSKLKDMIEASGVFLCVRTGKID